MADSTFRASEDRCYKRASCAGYIEGLCFNVNHEEKDDWCVLHGLDVSKE